MLTRLCIFSTIKEVKRYKKTRTNQVKAPKTKKVFTNDELLQLLKDEKTKNGLHVYTDRRKTIEEMLRMRGVKF